MRKNLVIIVGIVMAAFAAGVAAGTVLWQGEVGNVHGTVRRISADVSSFSIDTGLLNPSENYEFSDTFSATADVDSYLRLWVNDSSSFNGIEDWTITIEIPDYGGYIWIINSSNPEVSDIYLPGGITVYFTVHVYLNTSTPLEDETFEIRLYGTVETAS